jgi:hypothetical protein
MPGVFYSYSRENKNLDLVNKVRYSGFQIGAARRISMGRDESAVPFGELLLASTSQVRLHLAG